MRRIKLLLAVVAAMTMLVVMSAPAIADDGRDHNGNNNHNGWNNWNNWDNWDNWDNWNNHNRFNRFDNERSFLTNSFNDDCEWEFEEGWFLGFWGWQWGAWFLDC
jgi:hypothetical protein